MLAGEHTDLTESADTAEDHVESHVLTQRFAHNGRFAGSQFVQLGAGGGCRQGGCIHAADHDRDHFVECHGIAFAGEELGMQRRDEFFDQSIDRANPAEFVGLRFVHGREADVVDPVDPEGMVLDQGGEHTLNRVTAADRDIEVFAFAALLPFVVSLDEFIGSGFAVQAAADAFDTESGRIHFGHRHKRTCQGAQRVEVILIKAHAEGTDRGQQNNQLLSVFNFAEVGQAGVGLDRTFAAAEFEVSEFVSEDLGQQDGEFFARPVSGSHRRGAAHVHGVDRDVSTGQIGNGQLIAQVGEAQAADLVELADLAQGFHDILLLIRLVGFSLTRFTVQQAAGVGFAFVAGDFRLFDLFNSIECFNDLCAGDDIRNVEYKFEPDHVRTFIHLRDT